MTVDVLLVCYNQEAYIAQALESILMQRVDATLRLIVADDYSTDRTVEIIKTYESKTDIPFIYLSSDKNLGFVQNYKRAFRACHSDYVAILEGDDYWISPRHISNHIQFLDMHRECSMSMNRIMFLINGELKKLNNWTFPQVYKYISIKEQIVENQLGNLSACVFRTELLQKLPDEIFTIEIADWMLGIYMSQFGFISILAESTSVYRINNDGIWTHRSDDEKVKSLLVDIDDYDKFFDFKYKEYFQFSRDRLLKKEKKSFKTYCPPILLKIFKAILPPILYKKNYGR